MALTLSFKNLFPSPIYLFDEIDSNLDILTIERVFQFLFIESSNQTSQFIIISLQPSFYEYCPYLIGVYQYNYSSQTIFCSLKQFNHHNDLQNVKK